ncbi:MAG TPA: YetF domain-containing protein [Nocardioidaceae bacterium]|nr:YetF domain-containing protein [Nocardioidaceae bacterium]
MAEQFRISAETALTVVVTTVMIYLAFIALVRLTGSRSLTGLASFDFAAVVALGAVIGRTILLKEPTLMIGLVALSTLFGMQGLLGLLRQNRRVDRLIHRRPTMLVFQGELLRENMRACHVVEDEIRQTLRRAGARSLDDAECVVLERNGAVSVVLAGARLDPWLIADVAGVEPPRRS